MFDWIVVLDEEPMAGERQAALPAPRTHPKIDCGSTGLPKQNWLGTKIFRVSLSLSMAGGWHEKA